MIGILFSFGTEVVEVRIDCFNVFFRTSQFQRFADIDGIKLDKQGVIKEFPDLKDNDDWQKEGRKKFKEKGFAAGVNREQISSCSEIGLELDEFIERGLKAMQGIAADLGL